MLALGLQSIYLYFLYMRGFIYNFLLCKVYLTSDLKLTDLLKPEMPSPYFKIINEHNCQLYEYFIFGLSFLKCISQFMMHRYTLFSVILYCIAFDIPSRKSWSLYSKCVQYTQKIWCMKDKCYFMVEKKTL